jgi:hypothetical protein
MTLETLTHPAPPTDQRDQRSGFLIARPGRIAADLGASGSPVSLEFAQRAILPLLLALVVAFILAALIRESHPEASGTSRPSERAF